MKQMQLLFTFLLTLGVSSINAAESNAPVQVRLVDRATVRAPNITLGEIALIESSDPQLEEELRSIIVGAAPKLSRTQSIPAFRIRSLLLDRGINTAEVLGLKSTVSTEADAWTGDELRKQILAWVEGEVDGNTEVEVDFIQLPSKWAVPAGDATKLLIEAGRSDLAGSVTLTLKAILGDRVYAMKRARIQVARYQDTVVVTRPLTRGEKITLDAVTIKRTDVTQSRGMELAHLDDVVGLVTKRQLPIGSTINATDLEQPTVIERGTPTRVIVANGPVKISLNGAVALQDGKKGQRILFSHPMNKRQTLRAKVIRQGLAMIKMQ